MAPKAEKILCCIPPSLYEYWKFIFLSTQVIIYDWSFRFSAIYFPILLQGAFCGTVDSDLWGYKDIDCEGGADDEANEKLDDVCWTSHTFLVVKGFMQNLSSTHEYPGVMAYNRGVDELLYQDHYNIYWALLLGASGITMMPFFVWKIRGSGKILQLLDRGRTMTNEERVAKFLNARKMDGNYSNIYVCMKVWTLINHAVVHFLLIVFIGERYNSYGWDVVVTKFSSSYPQAIDVVFPVMAKCITSKIGMSGSEEITSAKCRLPWNYIARWIFFSVWWLNVLLFIFSLISILYLTYIKIRGKLRYSHYKLRPLYCYGARIDKSMGFGISHYSYTPKQIKKIRISFAEWLLLDFLEINVANDEVFAEFLNTFLGVKVDEACEMLMLITERKSFETVKVKTSDSDDDSEV